MKNIILFKRGKVDIPIKIFSDWWEAGKWADENVRAKQEIHYFSQVNWFKAQFYRLWKTLR